MKCDLVLIANPDIKISEDNILKLEKCFDNNMDCLLATGIEHTKDDLIGNAFTWKLGGKISNTLDGLMICSAFKYRNSCKKILEKTKGNLYVKVDCVIGSLILVDAKKFMTIGGYDERIFLYMEESVLARKIQLSNNNSYIVANAYFQHLHGASTQTVMAFRQRRNELWKSKRIFLKYYMNFSKFTLSIAHLMFNIGTLEFEVKKAIVKQ